MAGFGPVDGSSNLPRATKTTILILPFDFTGSLNMQSLNSVGASSTLLHHTSYNEERHRKEENDHKKQVCLDRDYEVEFVASPDDGEN